MPSIEQLIRLSTALKVSPAEILPSQEDEIREKLISLRREISDMIMRVDSPDLLEQVKKNIEDMSHNVD